MRHDLFSYEKLKSKFIKQGVPNQANVLRQVNLLSCAELTFFLC